MDREEQLAACWDNPRKLFSQENDSERYAEFFDAIGMPRNKINKTPNSFWEFSPPPSYTAQVQSRILCELIKGGFIPRLINSDDPHHIHRLLDYKLVSLHVNLGVPAWLAARQFDAGLDNNDNITFLSAAFCLAFSSAQRLLFRTTQSIANIKEADPTNKSPSEKPQRIEIKALEVRNASTYRLLEEIQLITASNFAYLCGNDESLAEIWEEMRGELEKLFDTFNIEPKILANRKGVAKFISRTDISQRLRMLITTNASFVRRVAHDRNIG